MADSATNRVNDAVLSNGAIDFYALLGESNDATTTRLRGRINDLYSEASANRDHRNMSKRREYEMLLELLPKCRLALLETDKRARYDAYLAEVKSGSSSVDFDTFMDQLSGKDATDAEERASLLAAKEPEAAKTATATAAKKKPAKKSNTSPIGTAIAIVLFFAVFLILNFATPVGAVKSILAGAVVAIVAWIVAHSDIPNRLSR